MMSSSTVVSQVANENPDQPQTSGAKSEDNIQNQTGCAAFLSIIPAHKNSPFPTLFFLLLRATTFAILSFAFIATSPARILACSMCSACLVARSCFRAAFCISASSNIRRLSAMTSWVTYCMTIVSPGLTFALDFFIRPNNLKIEAIFVFDTRISKTNFCRQYL